MNKKRIASIILAISILIGVNGFKPNKEDKVESFGFFMEDQAALPKSKDETTFAKYTEKIMGIKPTYKNDKYYLTPSDIEKLQLDDLEKCTFEYQDLSEALDELAETIKNNTEKDLLSMDDTTLDGITADEILRICLNNLFSNATNDIEEDICTLSGYQVVFSSDTSDERVLGVCEYDPKVITIHYNSIRNYVKNNLEDEVDAEQFEDEYFKCLCLSLEHELNHARQSKCEHRTEDIYRTVVHYNNPDSSTICESSAESALYNLNDFEISSSEVMQTYNYSNVRIDETLLLMLGVTNSSIDGYYNAIFDSDFNSLYNYFNLNTKDDIESFYRVLYAIDSINKRTELTRNLEDDQAIKVLVGNEYLIDLFKLSLKNMMEYTYNSDDFTLEENVNLYLILKNMITNKALLYYESINPYYGYGASFINDFNMLDEAYISFLSEYYDIDISSIRNLELFGNYIVELNSIIKNDISNADEEKLIKAECLLQKFPVLRSIMLANYVSEVSYLQYSSESEMELIRINSSNK